MNINANTFPDCKPSNLKKYLARNSPAYPAQSCPGLIIDGKDGKYVSKPDKKGNYKWFKIGDSKHSSPIKVKSPSSVKVKSISPIKKDNVVEKLGEIKLHLGEIKNLITSIKTEDTIKVNKIRQLVELHNNMTKFTCDFLDSIKVKTPTPKKASVKLPSPTKKTIKIKECPPEKVLNPETNRCIDKNSKKGKLLSK